MIKKSFVCLFLLLSFAGFTQNNKNKFVVNGNFTYSSNKTVQHSSYPTIQYKYRTFSSNLNIGYFLTNNFVVGISGAYLNGSSETNYDASLRTISKSLFNSYNTGVFARYNQFLKNSKFAFFYNLYCDPFFGKTTQYYSDVLNSSNEVKIISRNSGVHIGFQPGIIYFINSKFSIESSVGQVYYHSEKRHSEDDKSSSKQSWFGISYFMNSLNLGFSYYFGTKSKTTNTGDLTE
ncbi:MAG TPA: hypothetical protein VLB84_03260 [Bacteroidia bacterium]|jgi:hypothetical protein|nr:hypothetical protein [Bacteroidia bacterium]